MICTNYYRKSGNKYLEIFDRWKPVDLRVKPWRYYRGNLQSSGFWRGMLSNITITSPLLARLIFWRYRNVHLRIYDDSPRGNAAEIAAKTRGNKPTAD